MESTPLSMTGIAPSRKLQQDERDLREHRCDSNLLVSHERAKAKGQKIRTIDNSGDEFMIDHPQKLAKILLE